MTSPGRRRWTIFGSTLFGVLLFAAILSRVSGEDVTEVFGRLHVPPVLLAVLAGLLSTGFRVLRFRAFFPTPGRALSLYGAFSIIRAIGYVLPFKSGEVVALVILKKRGLAPSVAEAMPVWILLRLTDLVSLLSIFVASSAFGLVGGDLGARMFWISLALAASGACLLIILFAFRRRWSAAAAEESSRWWSRRLGAFRRGFEHLRSPLALIPALAWATLIWIGKILMGVFSLAAFQAPLGLASLLLASVVATVLNLIPLRAPLGIGTGDASWTIALVLAGVETRHAIVLALGVRLVQLLVIGLDTVLGLVLGVPRLETGPVAEEGRA